MYQIFGDFTYFSHLLSSKKLQLRQRLSRFCGVSYETLKCVYSLAK